MRRLNMALISGIFVATVVQCHAETNAAKCKPVVVLNNIKSCKLQNINLEHFLIGKWFTPHAADINITFNKDRTFVFNKFNTKTEEIDVLRGSFELTGNTLILKYDNKLQETFKFEKGRGADDNYYIKKGKVYYFVKSDL